jgi:farnesyl-diphosphate farnesyltransferase
MTRCFIQMLDVMQFFINVNKCIMIRYQHIIADVCKKMGNGMADSATDAALNTYGVISTDDFDRYCHYVAGLVGIGLTNLFGASGLEDEIVAKNETL